MGSVSFVSPQHQPPYPLLRTNDPVSINYNMGGSGHNLWILMWIENSWNLLLHCMTTENCLVSTSDDRHAKMPEEKHCDDKYFWIFLENGLYLNLMNRKFQKLSYPGDSQIIQESWYTLYMMHWNCDAWHRGFNNFHPAGQYEEWGGKTHLIEGLFYRQFCSGNFNRDCSYSS